METSLFDNCRPVKSAPLVSIIVPCYNYGHFIVDALESILAQNYDCWECIVIDDGSTDNSKDVVAEFVRKDPRFKYIYQVNKGMSAARNLGMREAAGTYLQFLDADDLLEKGKFASQVSFLEENPSVDGVYGDAAYFPSGEPEKRFAAIDGMEKCNLAKLSGGREELLKFLVVDNIMVISSPLLRAAVVDKFGFFDENLRALEDWEYWLRCFLHGMKIGYLPSDEPSTLIRFHPGSVSKNRLLMLKANVVIRNRIHPYLGDNPLEALNSGGIANARFALGVERMRRGDIVAGLAELASCSLWCYKISAFLKRTSGRFATNRGQ